MGSECRGPVLDILPVGPLATLDGSAPAATTMRADIVAYMIYLEGPEYPEYVMDFLT